VSRRRGRCNKTIYMYLPHESLLNVAGHVAVLCQQWKCRRLRCIVKFPLFAYFNSYQLSLDRLCGPVESWLQIQRSGFDSQRYQIFWGVVGLERDPLSLVSTIEELFGRKSSDSSLEIREYGCRYPQRWPRGTAYPQKLVLNSPDKWRSLCRCSLLAYWGHWV
jgi:hypothetical protein